MAEKKKQPRRAPNGYRVVLWADGFYHVYFGGECIAEELMRWKALMAAFNHKQQAAQPAGAADVARPQTIEVNP